MFLKAFPSLIGTRCLLLREDGEFYSPSQEFHPWSNVVWAECCLCPKDDDGRVRIRQECSCGIHATLWPDELLHYQANPNAVPFLVEAQGAWPTPELAAQEGEKPNYIWAHNYGFTAPGAQIVAIINVSKFNQEFQGGLGNQRTLQRQHLAMMYAEQKFGVSIIPYELSREILRSHWEANGCMWPKEIRE